jgi:hypothetical protein
VQKQYSDVAGIGDLMTYDRDGHMVANGGGNGTPKPLSSTMIMIIDSISLIRNSEPGPTRTHTQMTQNVCITRFISVLFLFVSDEFRIISLISVFKVAAQVVTVVAGPARNRRSKLASSASAESILMWRKG